MRNQQQQQNKQKRDTLTRTPAQQYRIYCNKQRTLERESDREKEGEK